jgi:hypothetical protein
MLQAKRFMSYHLSPHTLQYVVRSTYTTLYYIHPLSPVNLSHLRFADTKTAPGRCQPAGIFGDKTGDSHCAVFHSDFPTRVRTARSRQSSSFARSLCSLARVREARICRPAAVLHKPLTAECCYLLLRIGKLVDFNDVITSSTLGKVGKVAIRILHYCAPSCAPQLVSVRRPSTPTPRLRDTPSCPPMPGPQPTERPTYPHTQKTFPDKLPDSVSPGHGTVCLCVCAPVADTNKRSATNTGVLRRRTAPNCPSSGTCMPVRRKKRNCTLLLVVCSTSPIRPCASRLYVVLRRAVDEEGLNMMRAFSMPTAKAQNNKLYTERSRT